MINLLRMDLYRLKRSRSVYVCLAVLFAIAVLCYWMIWMILDPEGREFAAKIGMNALAGLEDEPVLQEGYNTLAMLRDIGMAGGGYSSIMGLVVTLFVCGDFNSGFIKNILSLHRNRWKYVGSKIITAGILNVFYLAAMFAFNLLLNLLCHNLFPYAGAADSLFYLTWAWFITTAFTALLILVATFTRSTAASVTATLVLGSGVLVTAVSHITGMFGINKWFSYTLYYNITYGPSHYTDMHDLAAYAIGAAFLILYSVTAAVTLSRRDI